MTSLPLKDSSERMWTMMIAACIAIGFIRFIVLAFVSDLQLMGDEAFYWEWAQRPALSYYTKGPGIAWLIAISTSIFGDTEFGVRAFAPVCGTIVALCAGLLARPYSVRAGAFAALLISCAPIFQGCSMLMTIDGPYAACWALACVAMRRAWLTETLTSWILTGIAVGIGFLFKYTILLLPLSWILFFAFSKRTARSSRMPGIALASCAATLCALPVIIWNMQEGWPTIAHLLGHLGLRGGDMPVTQGAGGWNYSPLWTLEYIASQIGFIGPGLILGLLGAWRALRDGGGSESDELKRYLACCALPLFVFYLLVSLIAEPEGNWPMGAGISALALAGIVMDEGVRAWDRRMKEWLALEHPRPFRGWWLRRPQSFSKLVLFASITIGVLTFVAFPLANQLLSMATRFTNFVPHVLPIARGTGAKIMAIDAESRLQSLREPSHDDPFLISKAYGVSAQMRFYMAGNPVTYCSSERLGHGRKTQYDYWSDTDLRAQALKGQNALAIGGKREDWLPFFELVSEGFTLEGDRKVGRLSFLCRGFKGVEVADSR